MSRRVLALLALGMAGMLGHATGFSALSGMAAALGASPAPRVFCAQRGLETFTSRFRLYGADGVVEVTPERYARVRGPYLRRNVYGAVLSYGPLLASDPRTQPMFEAVMQRTLCGATPALAELGVPTDRRVTVEIEPRPGTAPGLPLRFASDCR